MADDWLEEFGEIIGTSKDVIEGVQRTIEDVIGQSDPSPTKLPSQAEDEQRPIQEETVKTPALGESPSWIMPVLVIGGIILLLKVM